MNTIDSGECLSTKNSVLRFILPTRTCVTSASVHTLQVIYSLNHISKITTGRWQTRWELYGCAFPQEIRQRRRTIWGNGRTGSEMGTYWYCWDYGGALSLWLVIDSGFDFWGCDRPCVRRRIRRLVWLEGRLGRWLSSRGGLFREVGRLRLLFTYMRSNANHIMCRNDTYVFAWHFLYIHLILNILLGRCIRVPTV